MNFANPQISTVDEVSEYGEYIPSPDTIRRRCAEIRRTWSDSERRKRVAMNRGQWIIPILKTPKGA